MSRNLISANQSIFQALDRSCADNGEPLVTATQPRWIASAKKHRHIMTAGTIAEVVHFGPARKLARIDLTTRSYLLAVGFAHDSGFLDEAELELDPAFVTVGLSELSPRIVASPAQIKEAIDWGSKSSDSSYVGHDYAQVASLFPKMRVFSLTAEQSSAAWNTFFRLSLDECESGYSWIGGQLAGTLRSLCDLDQDRVPYKVLCRSVFDNDQSSFFLGLYRCLEALYAYASAKDLKRELNLGHSWQKIANALETTLGWHPREEGSLHRILKFGSRDDLRSVLAINGELTPPDNDEQLVLRAAKAIYGLRNSMVHYRPAQYEIDLASYDWSTICEAMTGLVVDVYEATSTI